MENQNKPDCKLIGENGNVFNLIGIVSKVLKKHGMEDKAKEFQSRCFGSSSYDTVLQIIQEYVNVT